MASHQNGRKRANQNKWKSKRSERKKKRRKQKKGKSFSEFDRRSFLPFFFICQQRKTRELGFSARPVINPLLALFTSNRGLLERNGTKSGEKKTHESKQAGSSLSSHRAPRLLRPPPSFGKLVSIRQLPKIPPFSPDKKTTSESGRYRPEPPTPQKDNTGGLAHPLRHISSCRAPLVAASPFPNLTNLANPTREGNGKRGRRAKPKPSSARV